MGQDYLGTVNTVDVECEMISRREALTSIAGWLGLPLTVTAKEEAKDKEEKTLIGYFLMAAKEKSYSIYFDTVKKQNEKLILAKIYLSDRENGGGELSLESVQSVEKVIKYLQNSKKESKA